MQSPRVLAKQTSRSAAWPQQKTAAARLLHNDAFQLMCVAGGCTEFCSCGSCDELDTEDSLKKGSLIQYPFDEEEPVGKPVTWGLFGREGDSCSLRKPVVGDCVVEARGVQVNVRGWELEAGEVAIVEEVDADGDFQLRNSSGEVSCFQLRHSFAFCKKSTVRARLCRPKGEHRQPAMTTPPRGASAAWVDDRGAVKSPAFELIQQAATPSTRTPTPKSPNDRDPIESAEVELEDGTRYRGEWRGRRRHGHGVLMGPHGVHYEGLFENDAKHGYGRFVDTQGSEYVGQWESNQRHGFGRYAHHNGSTYEGEWWRDEMAGNGAESWSDGSRYEGEFQAGRKHGMGSYYASSGSTYQGQFRNDRMDGDGYCVLPDGRAYQGQWLQGSMHGMGKMLMVDGSCYEGGYVNNKKEGEGCFTWRDGRFFKGNFRNGKQHGIGVVGRSDGTIMIRGDWRDGMQISAVRVRRRPTGEVGEQPSVTSLPSIEEGGGSEDEAASQFSEPPVIPETPFNYGITARATTLTNLSRGGGHLM